MEQGYKYEHGIFIRLLNRRYQCDIVILSHAEPFYFQEELCEIFPEVHSYF